MLRLHKHNKETYERLTQLFASNERVAVVQPTGTGKSFIIEVNSLNIKHAPLQ